MSISSLYEKLITDSFQNAEPIYNNHDIYHKMIAEVEDYAIILLDADGIILDWNKGAEKIKGYKAEEAIGRSFKIFYTKEHRANKNPEALLEIAVREGKVVDESWRVLKGGSLFCGNITITALFDDKHNVIGFSKVTRDLTERIQTENHIQELNRGLEKKLRSALLN